MRLFLTIFAPLLVVSAAVTTLDLPQIISYLFTVLASIATVYSIRHNVRKSAQEASVQATTNVNTGFTALVASLQQDNAVMRTELARNRQDIEELQAQNMNYQQQLTESKQAVAQLTEDLSQTRTELEASRQANASLTVELTKTRDMMQELNSRLAA